MSTLILLSAVPGSGKSTWARQYKAEHANTKIVASDEIRKEIFGKVNDFSNEALIWKTFLNRLNEFGKDKDATVIADATNLQNKFRKFYFESTPVFDKHILVIFNTPIETCLIQNRMREPERIVPEEAMKRLIAEFEPVTQEIMDLYDETIFIGKSFVAPELKK